MTNPHLIEFTTIIPEGECEQTGGGRFNERCARLLFESECEDEYNEDTER